MLSRMLTKQLYILELFKILSSRKPRDTITKSGCTKPKHEGMNERSYNFHGNEFFKELREILG